MKIRESRTWKRVMSLWKGDEAAEGVRQPDTCGIRSKLNKQQQQALHVMSESQGYQVLLDVIEMACIENDAKLINSAPADPEAVLAKHRMSKAFWQIFMAIQKKIEYERNEYLGLQKAKEQPREQEEEVQDTEILQ